jgi:hypothetical protein
MHPVWNWTVTTDYTRASTQYIYLNSCAFYVTAGKVKNLMIDSPNNLTSYSINSTRFDQLSMNGRIVAKYYWMESHRSSISGTWNGTWKSHMDQCSPLCFRTMHGSNNIWRQICDVEMKHLSLDNDHNLASCNLSEKLNTEFCFISFA